MTSSLPVDAISAASDRFSKPDGYEYSYGTAGFRTKAHYLPTALFRVGLLAVLRSQKLGGKTIGVMITASHNPSPDNGVKLIDPRGEMLEASWETFATQVCNAPSSAELVEVLQHLVEALKIDVSVRPSVVFGRDTRPSGEELVNALRDGLVAAGMSEAEVGLGQGEKEETGDKGILTTPMLHYIVRCMNTKGKGDLEEYGVPTTHGYYEKMVSSFRKLVDNKTPISHPILVDCANGVGAPCLSSFMSLLTSDTSKAPAVSFVPISTSIDEPSFLNASSGADYVKTNQKLPPILLASPSSPVVAPSSVSKSQPTTANSPTLAPGRLACSFDGDADRIIFYYLDEDTGGFRLLDGDKQAALAAGFLVDLVKQSGLAMKGQDGSENEDRGVDVGVVQTAYANGSSTKYLQQRLPVTCVPTGVKHLHHAAERFDIGVYFEANGHGTVLFSPSFISLLSTHQAKTPAQATALSHLRNLTLLINQTVGDALSDLLLVCTILIHRGWGPKEWDSSYLDLPNRLVKVNVADRNAFVTEDAERKLVSPIGAQARIDEEVRKYEGGRSFVRPSGTEDCVRVYAEAVSKTHAEELARRVSEIVEDEAGM